MLFSRLYKLDFVPLGLFAHLLVRALALARPLHYWKSGVIVSTTNTYVTMTTDDVTTIRISAIGPRAPRLLLHLDSTVQAVMEHSFTVNSEVSIHDAHTR